MLRAKSTWAVSSACMMTGCLSLPTAEQANLSYATVESSWPANAVCLNPPTPPRIAKEVLVGPRKTIVVAGGDNPISDADWPNFSPGLLDTKNSDRHLLYSRSCFARSPSKPATCIGADCREVVELGGYTWTALSKIEASNCLPDSSQCDGHSVHPGGLLVVVIRKCHEMVFEGKARMLHGPHGERAIMHATADGNPTTNVRLPAGWSLVEETLSEPLVLHPFGGGDACFYNVIRDEKQQAYHQIGFAGKTYP